MVMVTTPQSPPLISVFMRTSFMIYDTAEIVSLVFNIDYDDAFVDYLLVVEAMRNPDGYGWSSFYFKDRNKLPNAGPG